MDRINTPQQDVTIKVLAELDRRNAEENAGIPAAARNAVIAHSTAIAVYFDGGKNIGEIADIIVGIVYAQRQGSVH